MNTDAPKITSSGLLKDASDRLKSCIESLAHERRIAPRNEIFLEGDEGDAIYLVLSGQVEISILSEDGRKLSLNVLGPGEVFGEISLLDGSPRTASAVSIEEATLLRVSRKDLMRALEDDPRLAIDFVQLVCRRLRWVHGLLQDRTFKPLPERLAKRLLLLAKEDGEGDNAVTLRFSQAELADFLGATREGVAKVLGAWRKNGWIEISRGAITIKHIAHLRTLARLDPGDGAL